LWSGRFRLRWDSVTTLAKLWQATHAGAAFFRRRDETSESARMPHLRNAKDIAKELRLARLNEIVYYLTIAAFFGCV
jgi:hypothetical protein